MYRLLIKGVEKTQQYEELVRVFLPDSDFELAGGAAEDAAASAEVQNTAAEAGTQKSLPKDAEEDADALRVFEFQGDKDALRRSIYEDLAAYTGKRPRWGVLTGIRPVKLAGELLDGCGSERETADTLKTIYLLSDDKIRLTMDTLRFQREVCGRPPRGSMSVYIGIPFCPTRCLYCSFTSNQVGEEEMERYLAALFMELDSCGRRIKERGIALESLYIGGGTPTALSERQLERLLERIVSDFDTKTLREFTVEAGRPDTFTREKLSLIRDAGADRISINPQSMKAETLRIIGRQHTPEDTVRAFEMAHACGIGCINADLIAGLPGENADDFAGSLETVCGLGADDITLHTLAVKRASRLKDVDRDFNYRNEDVCVTMLDHAHSFLAERGYNPYYLYRQKHTSGSTENLGLCRERKASFYNVRIMEEAQSILALGAGGISKVYFPEENRLERVANVSNYEIYIDRIDEMIERKERNFWR